MIFVCNQLVHYCAAPTIISHSSHEYLRSLHISAQATSWNLSDTKPSHPDIVKLEISCTTQFVWCTVLMTNAWRRHYQSSDYLKVQPSSSINFIFKIGSSNTTHNREPTPNSTRLNLATELQCTRDERCMRYTKHTPSELFVGRNRGIWKAENLSPCIAPSGFQHYS